MYQRQIEDTSSWLKDEIGKRIKESRERNNLTQSQLATLTGLNRSSIAKIEAGTQRLALDTFCILADILKEPPSALLPKIADCPATLENRKRVLSEASTSDNVSSEEKESILVALGNSDEI